MNTCIWILNFMLATPNGPACTASLFLFIYSMEAFFCHKWALCPVGEGVDPQWPQGPTHALCLFFTPFNFFFHLIYFPPYLSSTLFISNFILFFYLTHIYYSENIPNIDPYYFCLYYFIILCFMSFEQFFIDIWGLELSG